MNETTILLRDIKELLQMLICTTAASSIWTAVRTNFDNVSGLTDLDTEWAKTVQKTVLHGLELLPEEFAEKAREIHERRVGGDRSE